MTGLELVLIGGAAVGTAALTAMAGAGGGIILLIVLLQFVEPEVAIPLHGIVQLVSNGTRAATLRASAELGLLRWYVVPLLPGAIVGYLLLDGIPVAAAQAAVGGFALLATWWPAATAWLAPGVGGDVRRFAIVGAVAGVTNPTLGAPGPLLAPAFRAATRGHVEMVATFAVAQVLNHASKILVFAVAGVAWSEHLDVLLVAGGGVVVGTRLGAVWLGRVDLAVLTWMFRVAVTVGAARLVLEAVL